MKRRSRRKPGPNPAAVARAAWSKDFAEADGELAATLARVGQKLGYIDAKGKLTPEGKPPTTTEQFNASIREVARGTTGRLSRLMGDDHGEA